MAQTLSLSASGKLVTPDGQPASLTLEDIVLDDATFDDVTIDVLTAGATTCTTLAASSTVTSAAHAITSASANALVAGLAGATNPALQVDASTASSATGIKVKSAAAASGVAVSAVSSGTDEALTIDAKGAGAITLGSVSTGGVKIGSGAETAAIKAIIHSGNISVTVPSITDPDIAKVDVDVSSLTFACAVGDQVLVTPTAALPTNCRFLGAIVTATDTVTITYGSEGGNVTGAGTNHKFTFFDLT